jgi:hypothetical protein
MKTTSSIVLFFLTFTFLIPSVLVGIFIYWLLTNVNKNPTEQLKTIKISKNNLNNRIENEPIKIRTSSNTNLEVKEEREDDDDPISVNIKHIEFPTIETKNNIIDDILLAKENGKKWNYNHQDKTLSYDFSDDEDEYNYRKYVIRNINNKTWSSNLSDVDSYDT